MLSFANLNEAWGEVRRTKQKPKQTVETKKEEKNEESVHCSSNFGTACTPIVIRITDPTIVKDLSIYNDDYKHDILLDIIKKGLYKPSQETEHEHEQKYKQKYKQKYELKESKILKDHPTHLEKFMNTFFDDEYTEIISVVAISMFLLFLIEGIKKYNKI